MDLVSVCLGLLVLSLIALWTRVRKEKFSIFKRNGIPGPEPSFWTGNFKEIAAKQEECILEYTKEYGGIFGFFVGAIPLLVVTDKELIKIIQVKEFDKFIEREPLLSDFGIPQQEFLVAIFPSKGEIWKRNRMLISPSFSTKNLKKVMPIMNTATEIFMEKLQESCSKDSVNIVKFFRNVAMDIITKTQIGIDTGVQHATESKILDSTRLFLTSSLHDILPVISVCFPEFEPIPTKLRSIKDALRHAFGLASARYTFEQVQKVVNYRRERSERREDTLQTLMEAKGDSTQLSFKGVNELEHSDESKEDNRHESKHESPKRKDFSFSDNDIVANACNMLVAGYDTTNTTLSFLAYELTRHQDIQERLREEINEQLSGKTEIMYEDLSKLNYMDQVISETLRIHPLNMITISRIASEPMTYKGMTIPKGMGICIPSYTLHKNPDNWPDPERFDPERFSPENKGALNPDIYQPFGYGPRACVGKRFALLVLKMALTKLIRSYRLKSCGDEEKEPKMHYTLFVTGLEEFLVKVEPVS